MRLLLVEDDLSLASGLKLGLSGAGYAVDWVGSGERAEAALAAERFDIAIVDIGLPGVDGLELTRRIRRDGCDMPLLMLTARDTLDARVGGLDSGADDYMLKPFELPELLARLRALLRRSHAQASSVLRLGALEIDSAAHLASIDGRALELAPREWAVLQYLMLHAPKPVAKDALMQALTGWDKEITTNAVEVYISRLRAKLEPHGLVLRCVRGFGYRLELREPDAAPP